MNALNKPAMVGAVAANYRSPINITVARTLSDIMQIVAVRAVVYMSEQDCPFHEEYDGNDFGGATHLIARVEGEPVGVLRLRWFADFAKLERLAVLREHRGGRTTFMLIDAAFDLAARKGYRKIAGHAQPRLVPFWIRKYNGRIRPGRPTFMFSDYEYTEVEADLIPPPDAVSIDTDPMVLLRPEGEWDRPGVLDRSAARAKGFG